MPWRDQMLQSAITRIFGAIGKFRRDARGNIIVIFSLSTPAILLLAGFAIDYGSALVQQKRLQTAVDAGAIAGAKELTLVNSQEEPLQVIAERAVIANLKGIGPSPQITVTASTQDLTVNLSAVQNVKTHFGGFYGNAITQVKATAEAVVVGSTRICVLALDTSKSGSVSLEQSARITGKGCAVYTNSVSDGAVVGKNNSLLQASLTCAVGGYSGNSSNFSPEPIEDCPLFPDPLADRPEPDGSGPCLATDLEIIDQNVTLEPGVYCGGIQISGSSNINFESGVYVIKDGPLYVDGTSSIFGENVGFYLTGNTARFTFTAGTSIELSAPIDGELAGILFFESRTKTGQGTHKILSNNARLLLGTLYLSRSKLVVDADAPVADQSAYTAIIARELKLFSGPNLVLNTDYDQTEVPVPDGIKGVGNVVSLTK